MKNSLSRMAETHHYLDGPGARFAYRRFGTGTGVPLVLALRFRGTMDHWDPAFLDALGAERDVIVFDDIGHGRTSGVAPTTMDGLAGGLTELVDALGLTEVVTLHIRFLHILASAMAHFSVRRFEVSPVIHCVRGCSHGARIAQQRRRRSAPCRAWRAHRHYSGRDTCC